MKTLYKSVKDVEFVRTDHGKYSKVVVSRQGIRLTKPYIFRNVAPYEHPMLSWENLDKCGGWVHDEADIIRLVLEKKKPAGMAFVYIAKDKAPDYIKQLNLPSESSEIECIPPELSNNEFLHSHNQSTIIIHVAVPGYKNLAEIFDIEEIRSHYLKLGLDMEAECNMGAIKNMLQEPILNLLVRRNNRFAYDFANPSGKSQDIITGLLLGYPLESTASFIGIK